MKGKQVRRAFGVKLRAVRTAKGLSQEELAELAGCSTEYISRMERGLCSPSFDMIATLSEALMIKLREFFDFESS